LRESFNNDIIVCFATQLTSVSSRITAAAYDPVDNGFGISRVKEDSRDQKGFNDCLEFIGQAGALFGKGFLSANQFSIKSETVFG
jgi:hypothetical protein